MPIVARKPNQSKYAKILFFSPHGHGKTHLLGTAQFDERTFPMALLNWEGGDHTLSGLDIDVFDMTDMSDFKEAKKMLSHPKTPYKSAGVDSVSETQISGFMNILEKDTNRGDPDLLAQQDWGISLIQMRRFIRDFKFLPMHTFFTALAREDLKPKLGKVQIPAVQGAFSQDLPAVVDTVAYLDNEPVAVDEDHPDGMQRILYLHSFPKLSVKCRTPWGTTVPSALADPDITFILDTLGFK